MTKEQLIEQVEIAHKVYELLKPIPYYERYLVNGMVDQLSRADQQKEDMAAKSSYGAASLDRGYPVPSNTAEASR